MNITPKKNGFSLAEVLLAVCTLAIGMSFIGGTFVVAIHLSTVATERTIASVVADEAFAKIRLYGVDPNLLTSEQERIETVSPIPPEEFAYPSTKTTANKQYYWSALCRKTTDGLVQVTVFVSRKIGSNDYQRSAFQEGSEIPVPIEVVVFSVLNENLLTIAVPNQFSFINNGYTIVTNLTGRLYRVLERDADAPDTLILDKPCLESESIVWVVPPPVGGGRNPCIAIYQQIIRF
jgi:hypothetical protein